MNYKDKEELYRLRDSLFMIVRYYLIITKENNRMKQAVTRRYSGVVNMNVLKVSRHYQVRVTTRMTPTFSSSTLSTYEDEFPSLAYMPKMDTREMMEEKADVDEALSETNVRPRNNGDGNNNFRFAFKNPRSKRQQQRQEHRAKKIQSMSQNSQAGRVKSQSPPKKPKNPESKQPQSAQPKTQEKLDEQSTPTKKRRRRNRRKKKSTTESGKHLS